MIVKKKVPKSYILIDVIYHPFTNTINFKAIHIRCFLTIIVCYQRCSHRSFCYSFVLVIFLFFKIFYASQKTLFLL